MCFLAIWESFLDVFFEVFFALIWVDVATIWGVLDLTLLEGQYCVGFAKNQLLLDALKVILIKLRVMPDPNSKRTFRTVIVDMRSNGNFVYVSQDAPQKLGKKGIHFWRLWSLSVIIDSDWKSDCFR